jgi:hypothetical protein
MSFAGVQGREKPVTEETLAHHALSTAHVLGYPFQVLTRAKSEFKLNMIQEVKSVSVKYTEAFAGYPYKVVNTFFVNSWCRSWTAPFQSASR